MFASLCGRLADDSPERTVIDVGGVGYRIACSRHTLAELRAADGPVDVRIHTHMRDGAITLYGFRHATEETVFVLLTTVHNVGPAAALAILNAIRADGAVRALVNKDHKPFMTAAGIGRKTALRIVHDLDGKVPDYLTMAAPADDPSADARRLARDGLAELGFRDTEIETALDDALRRDPEADATTLIRTVLAARGRRQSGTAA